MHIQKKIHEFINCSSPSFIEILGEKPKVSVASKMLALLLTISPGLGEE